MQFKRQTRCRLAGIWSASNLSGAIATTKGHSFLCVIVSLISRVTLSLLLGSVTVVQPPWYCNSTKWRCGQCISEIANDDTGQVAPQVAQVVVQFSKQVARRRERNFYLYVYIKNNIYLYIYMHIYIDIKKRDPIALKLFAIKKRCIYIYMCLIYICIYTLCYVCMYIYV